MNKTIIGVKFKKPGKIYFFDPKKENFKKGDFVIVDTANGMEFAEVVVENKEMPGDNLVNPLKSISLLLLRVVITFKIQLSCIHFSNLPYLSIVLFPLFKLLKLKFSKDFETFGKPQLILKLNNSESFNTF